MTELRQRQPRVKDGNHLKWIRKLSCLVTGRHIGIEAAHIRYHNSMFGKRQVGIGERPDDRWAIPLHYEQHRDQHAYGDERDWWRRQGIDPLPVCLALYEVSGDDEAGEEILRQAKGNLMAYGQLGKCIKQVFDQEDYPPELSPANVKGRKMWRKRRLVEIIIEKFGMDAEQAASFRSYCGALEMPTAAASNKIMAVKS